MERVGEAWRIIARRVWRRVGIGHHRVERVLVDIDTQHVVLRPDLVPQQHIPVAELEGSLEVVALNGVWLYGRMLAVLHLAGIVAAHLEDVGLDIVDLAVDTYLAPAADVNTIPAVVPLCLYVDVGIQLHHRFPIALQIELHHRHLNHQLLDVVEVERRLGAAG